MVATYSDRLLILKCSFISAEEKSEALENAMEVVDAPPEFSKVEFAEQLVEVNQILYVNSSQEIDFENLPDEIPITYCSYQDLIEHVTIHCAMESAKLTDSDTIDVLTEMCFSSPRDSCSPLNDEVFQAFLDYHWSQNQRGYIVL